MALINFAGADPEEPPTGKSAQTMQPWGSEYSQRGQLDKNNSEPKIQKT
ncbi:MAG: hypothetical protein NTV57_13045 [Cyanobacteria bacterium]|nr:hypothetical protein [Cyanobacteriota bacterium]